MKKIDAILDTILLPEVRFEVKDFTDEIVTFEERDAFSSTVTKLVEAQTTLDKTVATALNRAIIINNDRGVYKYTINRKQVYDSVWTVVRDFHVQLWLIVNNKTEFNRTKLKKDLSFANSAKFKETCLELLLDAEKYGITRATLKKTMEVKPIHKFIALKFQAMVEAECPR